MRVLVTRPEEDARALVAALDSRGHEALVEPMLVIAPAREAAAPLDLTGVQALLFTSANGVRAFARQSQERGLPVFAVGEASAAAARESGFARVESAGGDVADLARLAAERLRPADGALFQGAARTLAGDLKGALEAAGFAVRRKVLYEARPAPELSAAARAALAEGRLDAAVFFSPRTAETFVRLVGQAGLGSACARLAALALSEAVAEKLRALAWREIRVAERPNQDALLACLDGAGAAPEAAVTDQRMPEEPTPDRSAAAPTDPLSAQEIITRFGGIRPMATKLGVAVSTVQGWRERGAIPSARREQVLAAARAHGIELGPGDLAAEEHGRPAAGAGPGGPGEHRAAAPAAGAGEAERRPGPAPAPAPPPPRRPAVNAWLGGAVLGIAALALGALGAVATRDLWMTPAPPPAPADGALAGRVAALGGRLEALEAAAKRAAGLEDRLAALESGAGKAAPAAGLARIEDQVAALGRRLDGVESRLTGAESGLKDLESELKAQAGRTTDGERLAQQVADLSAKLEALGGLKQRVDEISAGAAQARASGAAEAALAIAILQLRDALRGSAPFAAEYAMLSDLAAAPALGADGKLAAALAPIAPYAETGIPSLVTLKAEFPATARRVVAQAQGGQGEDWVSGVMRRVSGLVTVRPSGPVEGSGPGAVVARAEARLADDDLAGAVKELDALAGPAAEAAGPWRAKAAQRLAAQKVVTDLGRALAARLASAGG